MTTQNIAGDFDGNIERLQAAQRIIADSVMARNKVVTDQIAASNAQREQDARYAEIARRAIDQRHADNRAVLDEEAGQLRNMLNVTPSVTTTPEPAPEPVVVTPPAQPAEPVVASTPEPTTPSATVVIPVAPEPQEALGLPAAQTVPVTTVITYDPNPRKWTGLQWFLAIILGLVGLVIGLNTIDWLAGTMEQKNWFEWIIAILGFVWVITWIGLGFFGGSWIGFKLTQQRSRTTVTTSAS